MPDYMLKYLEEGAGAASTASASNATNELLAVNSQSVQERDVCHSTPQPPSRSNSRQASPFPREGCESVLLARDRHASPGPALISKAFNICVDRMSLFTEYCNSSSDSSAPNSPAIARKASCTPESRRRNSIERRLWDRVKLCEHNYAKAYCSDDDVAAAAAAAKRKMQLASGTSQLTNTDQDSNEVRLNVDATENIVAAPVAPAISLSTPSPMRESSSEDDGGDILRCQNCHIAVHASRCLVLYVQSITLHELC